MSFDEGFPMDYAFLDGRNETASRHIVVTEEQSLES